MTETYVEIPRIKWEKQRSLGLDKGFRDATRDYLKWRWPTHTAKSAAREFDLSLDQGRSAANGTPSLTTIERIFKNGGPLVALHILARMGLRIADLIEQMDMAHVEDGRALVALVRDPWTGPDRGDPGGGRGSWLASDRHVPTRRQVG